MKPHFRITQGLLEMGAINSRYFKQKDSIQALDAYQGSGGAGGAEIRATPPIHVKDKLG